MILKIDDSVISTLNPSCDIGDKISLLHLCLAAREGKHLVVGNRKVFDYLIQLDGLDSIVVTTFKQLRELSTQFNNLVEECCCFITIMPSGTTFEKKVVGAQEVVFLPINFIDDSSLLQPTAVVGENDDDANLFMLIGKTFIDSKKYRNIKIVGTPVNGGGDTTAKVYDQLQTSNRIAICVVDTDRLSPFEPIKQTAAKVVQMESSLHPLSAHYKLDGHEVENLFSTRHIEESSVAKQRNVPAKTFDILRLVDTNPQLRKYVDLKNGIASKKIGQLNPDSRRFWTVQLKKPPTNYTLSHPCILSGTCGGTDCCDVLIPAVGDKILSDALSYLSNQTYKKISEGVCQAVKDQWEEIGLIIFSWCIASPKIRA